jgi:alpha-tubulin suppressor-like RCC1 family protein
MPTFYNYTENGVVYSLDDVFVPADAFRQGNLWVWGSRSIGNFRGTNSGVCTPVTTFAGSSNWLTVANGNYNSAAIKTDGTLWTWGEGFGAGIGDGFKIDRCTPVTTFAGGNNWKQVSCAYNTGAAIKTDGTLWVWGGNYYALLADNTQTDRCTPVTTFAGGTNWKQVSLGYHAAAIKTDGTLWTWGQIEYGALGNNTSGTVTWGRKVSTPITTFAGGTNWKQVSTSINGNTAAIKTDGTLWVWGTNSYGTLGTNSERASLTPVTTFAGGTNWKQVSAGGYNVSAIKTDGTLWTWGQRSHSAINYTRPRGISTPSMIIGGGNNWKSVSTGGFIIATKTDGTLWSWGERQSSIEGFLVNRTPISPRNIFPGTNWSIAYGNDDMYVIGTDGNLWGWGTNSNGELGINATGTRSTPVTTITGGTNWKSVSAGFNTVAAVKTDGTLWTWGSNYRGSIGDDTSTNRRTPVTTFAGGTNWSNVSITDNQCAAVKTDGTLWVWGRNFNFALGTNEGTSVTKRTPVTTFSGGTNWSSVTVGSNLMQAIKTDGTLWVWGANNAGQLGVNDTIDKATPVTTFAGGTNWSQLGRGGSSAIKTDGTLWVWGYNSYARLGIGDDPNNKSTPVTTFAGGTNWSSISDFSNKIAAIKTDGTLWMWGDNGGSGKFGVLGIGGETNGAVLTPITTFAGGTNWKLVNCSSYSTINAAIKTDGTLWMWGEQGNAQFGIGSNATVYAATPITTFAGGTNWKQVEVKYRRVSAIQYQDDYV